MKSTPAAVADSNEKGKEKKKRRTKEKKGGGGRGKSHKKLNKKMSRWKPLHHQTIWKRKGANQGMHEGHPCSLSDWGRGVLTRATKMVGELWRGKGKAFTQGQKRSLLTRPGGGGGSKGAKTHFQQKRGGDQP